VSERAGLVSGRAGSHRQLIRAEGLSLLVVSFELIVEQVLGDCRVTACGGAAVSSTCRPGAIPGRPLVAAIALAD
jgi:hypothetical protein